jgi:hypothetical protein
MQSADMQQPMASTTTAHTAQQHILRLTESAAASSTINAQFYAYSSHTI